MSAPEVTMSAKPPNYKNTQNVSHLPHLPMNTHGK